MITLTHKPSTGHSTPEKSVEIKETTATTLVDDLKQDKKKLDSPENISTLQKEITDLALQNRPNACKHYPWWLKKYLEEIFMHNKEANDISILKMRKNRLTLPKKNFQLTDKFNKKIPLLFKEKRTTDLAFEYDWDYYCNIRDLKSKSIITEFDLFSNMLMNCGNAWSTTPILAFLPIILDLPSGCYWWYEWEERIEDDSISSWTTGYPNGRTRYSVWLSNYNRFYLWFTTSWERSDYWYHMKNLVITPTGATIFWTSKNHWVNSFILE